MSTQKYDKDGLRLATYERKRGQVATVETDDQTAILNIVLDSMKKHMGRPATYADNEEGLTAFKEQTFLYLQHVQEVNQNDELEKKLIPDVESWAVFCGVTRQTIFHYERRGQQWATFIQMVRESIAAVKKQLALTYRTAPVVAIFDLVNNHQYVSTSEIKLSTERNDETIKHDDAETIKLRHSTATLPKLPDCIEERNDNK